MCTQSNTESQCDFCRASLDASVYQPKATRRAAQISICQNCGLIQSVYGSTSYERISTLSCDADWGNVRHGKGARLKAALHILKSCVDWTAMNRVLDVGSNRGDFLLWLRENQPHLAIHAIEPDASVVDFYKDELDIELSLARLENVTLASASYDFIYCAHTLEHASSASEMLQQMFDALVPEGLLYLEVPNIEAITLLDTVEEFFIDKHSFHFDRPSLIEFVESLGFEIISGRDDLDPFNISLLLRRRSDGGLHIYHSQDEGFAEAHRILITNYANILTSNRARLRQLIEARIVPFMERQKVAFWGAGRIFDALVKYGKLDTTRVQCLVDRHLWHIVNETHGVSVQRPEVLKRFEPQVVIVLARSAAGEIADEVRRFGVRHVVKFQDLLAQCS